MTERYSVGAALVAALGAALDGGGGGGVDAMDVTDADGNAATGGAGGGSFPHPANTIRATTCNRTIART